MKLRHYIDAQRGRAAELARALRITPCLIAQWASTRQVPAERCPSIERATGGLVRCEDLRPDVDWAYLRATDCGVKVGAGDTAAFSAESCNCLQCLRDRKEGTRLPGGLWVPAEAQRMVLCAVCGNKRCPHATDHRNECTASNEPGQPGSVYGGTTTATAREAA